MIPNFTPQKKSISKGTNSVQYQATIILYNCSMNNDQGTHTKNIGVELFLYHTIH